MRVDSVRDVCCRNVSSAEASAGDVQRVAHDGAAKRPKTRAVWWPRSRGRPPPSSRLRRKEPASLGHTTSISFLWQNYQRHARASRHPNHSRLRNKQSKMNTPALHQQQRGTAPSVSSSGSRRVSRLARRSIVVKAASDIPEGEH